MAPLIFRQTVRIVIASLVFFAFGYSAANYWPLSTERAADLESGEQRLGGYLFINPLLECDLASGNFSELRGFRRRVTQSIEAEKASGAATQISLYYRDMNNGPWFGIEIGQLYSPASMLKVPVMIALFKRAEKDPGILSERVRYASSTEEVPQYFGHGEGLKVGAEYTIEELVRRMIVNSDNAAYRLLIEKFGEMAVMKVYEDLDLVTPEITAEDFMSVGDYASIFRVLYNASYLDRDFSERALALLSETDFYNGLSAGLPPGTKIAQKYGERSSVENELVQLHDCGLVYYPGRPYLLCVMTKGGDFEALAGAISRLSGVVFDQVKNNPDQ